MQDPLKKFSYDANSQPKELVAKWSDVCGSCKSKIRAGEIIWWVAGRVLCTYCGRGKDGKVYALSAEARDRMRQLLNRSYLIEKLPKPWKPNIETEFADLLALLKCEYSQVKEVEKLLRENNAILNYATLHKRSGESQIKPQNPIPPGVDPSVGGMLNALLEEKKHKVKLRCSVTAVSNSAPVSLLTLDARRTNDLLELREGWEVSAYEPGIGYLWTAAEIIDIEYREPVTIAVSGKREIVAQAGQECHFFKHDFLKPVREWADSKKQAKATLPPSYLSLIEGRGLPVRQEIRQTSLSYDLARLSLRSAQQKALELTQKNYGIVWGPPGTGKTYTLGALVSVLKDERRKILVLAPTNVAADNAVLAIDDALTRLGYKLEPGELIRPGTTQLPELEDRPHLLAWEETLEQMSRALRTVKKNRLYLEQRRRICPVESRARLQQSIALNKKEDNEIKSERSRQFWRLAQEARIIVTTLHSAMNNEEILNSLVDEELVLIIEEASMVPRFMFARAMDLEPTQVFLFGDFKQLAPVQENKDITDANSRFWIGDSALSALGLRTLDDASRLEKAGSLVMLTEQSRMHGDLCQTVSDNFYGGRLSVMGDIQAPPLVSWLPTDAIVVANPDECVGILEDTLNGKYDGPGDLANYCRNGVVSSVLIAKYVLAEKQGVSALLLSPFRNQAAELRKLANTVLPDDGRWKAGTVHISQGQESDLVILSPVNPGHKWLAGEFGEDELERLLCVAFSRARTQVIVIVRPEEIPESPLLERLCQGRQSLQAKMIRQMT